jgi:hypothetical protein
MKNIFGVGKNGLKGLVGEEDVVLGVNQENGLLEASQGGLKLRELPRAGLLQLRDLRDEFIRCGAQLIPVVGCLGAGLVIAEERLSFTDSLMQAP